MNGQVGFSFLLRRSCSLNIFVQVSCEGPLGKTSLFEPIPADPATYFRKDDMTPKVDPAEVKKVMGY